MNRFDYEDLQGDVGDVGDVGAIRRRALRGRGQAPQANRAGPGRPGTPNPPGAPEKFTSKVATPTLNTFYSSGYWKDYGVASAQIATQTRMLFFALNTAPTGGAVQTLPSGAKDTLIGNFPINGDKLGLERNFEFGGLSLSMASNLPSLLPHVLEEFRAKASIRICVGAQPLAAADKIMVADLPNPFEPAGGTTSAYDRKNEVGGRDINKSFLRLSKPLFVTKDKGFTIMLDELPTNFVAAINGTFSATHYFKMMLHMHRVRVERPLGVTVEA